MMRTKMATSSEFLSSNRHAVGEDSCSISLNLKADLSWSPQTRAAPFLEAIKTSSSLLIRLLLGNDAG